MDWRSTEHSQRPTAFDVRGASSKRDTRAGGRDERGRRPSSLPDLGRVDVSEAIPDTFCGPSLLRADFFVPALPRFLWPRNHARWAALSGLVSGRQSVASMSVARRSQRCAVSTRVSLKSGFGASAAIAKQRWAFSRNSLGSPGMLCLLRNPPVPGIDSKREYWSRVKADWPRHGYEAPRANAREGRPRRSPGRGPGLVPHLRRVRVTVVSAFTAVNKRPPAQRLDSTVRKVPL
jgi:hypothetical protein